MSLARFCLSPPIPSLSSVYLEQSDVSSRIQSATLLAGFSITFIALVLDTGIISRMGALFNFVLVFLVLSAVLFLLAIEFLSLTDNFFVPAVINDDIKKMLSHTSIVFEGMASSAYNVGLCGLGLSLLFIFYAFDALVACLVVASFLWIEFFYMRYLKSKAEDYNERFDRFQKKVFEAEKACLKLREKLSWIL